MVATGGKIIDELTELSPEQLREVVSRATFLMNPSGKAVLLGKGRKLVDGDQRMVLDEVDKLLAGRSGYRSAAVMARTKTGKGFARGSEALMAFIRSDFGKLTVLEIRSVLRVLLRCMAQEISRTGAPVCARTLALQMENVTETVDRAFPSYRQCGLLPFVVKRKLT